MRVVMKQLPRNYQKCIEQQFVSLPIVSVLTAQSVKYVFWKTFWAPQQQCTYIKVQNEIRIIVQSTILILVNKLQCNQAQKCSMKDGVGPFYFIRKIYDKYVLKNPFHRYILRC